MLGAECHCEKQEADCKRRRYPGFYALTSPGFLALNVRPQGIGVICGMQTSYSFDKVLVTCPSHACQPYLPMTFLLIGLPYQNLPISTKLFSFQFVNQFHSRAKAGFS